MSIVIQTNSVKKKISKANPQNVMMLEKTPNVLKSNILNDIIKRNKKIYRQESKK